MKRKTTEEFIRDAIKVHGDKYDYSKTKYTISRNKVKIICKIHGEFTHEANSHLRGAGCIQCSYSKLKTTEQFIQDAISIHGDKYDYSKVEYINDKKKVKIICLNHEEFYQTPRTHLSGRGCARCYFNRRYSQTSIKWLNKIMKQEKIFIQHAENKGEFVILPNSKIRTDGYCKETNTIYEFYGDFWHGNPEKFKPNELNPIINKTYGELYQKTIERENLIKELGYNLVIMWESDFK